MRKYTELRLVACEEPENTFIWIDRISSSPDFSDFSLTSLARGNHYTRRFLGQLVPCFRIIFSFLQIF